MFVRSEEISLVLWVDEAIDSDGGETLRAAGSCYLYLRSEIGLRTEFQDEDESVIFVTNESK